MSSFVEINSLRAHYLTTGEGRDVVLMHGWGCDHTIWARLGQHLSKANGGRAAMRVTAIDFPGFGASDQPPVAWTVEDYTCWFEAFLAALGIKDPILVGHSFGGRVAVVFASRNAVEKMVLTDAAGIKPRRSVRYYIKVWGFKLLKRLAPIVLGKKRSGALIDRRRAKAGSADYAAASPVMRATLSRVVNDDLRRFMSSISAPTLLVWGSADTATPLRDAKIMERLIPDAGLVVFEGAEHYAFLEREGQFNAIMDNFLC